MKSKDDDILSCDICAGQHNWFICPKHREEYIKYCKKLENEIHDAHIKDAGCIQQQILDEIIEVKL